jgi:hypothetical protein
MRHPVRVAGAFLGLLLSMVPAVSALQSTAARDWHQQAADAGRTSAVDVEPVRGEPREAWSFDPKGEVFSEPVCCAGVVYFVGGIRTKRTLFAIHALTGEVQATKVLPEGGWAEIAVWQGTVVLNDAGVLRGYPHQKTRFSAGWSLPQGGGHVGAPLLSEGSIYIADMLGSVSEVDPRRGKVVRSGPAGTGRLAMAGQGADRSLIGLRVGPPNSDSPTVRMLEVPLADFGPRCTTSRIKLLGDAPGCSSVDCVTGSRLVVMPGPKPAFLLTSSVSFAGENESFPGVFAAGTAGSDPVWMSEIRTPPAVHGDSAYGFDTRGNLIRLARTGKAFTLVASGSLPPGARPGPASVARGVLFSGNWALEIESGRVLWCRPEIRALTPAIPAGDRLLVVATEANLILGLTDLPAGESAAVSSDPPPTERPAPGPLPAEEDGVLAEDGRWLPGTLETLADGGLRVAGGKGDPVALDAAGVVLTQVGGRAELRGEERKVYESLAGRLERDFVEDLVRLFESYLSASLLSDGRRLLDEAKDRGLGQDRFEKLNRLLAGQRESTEKMAKARLGKREEEVRRAARDGFRRMSSWCGKRTLHAAGSALLFDAERILPDAATEAEARAFLPAGCPFGERKDAGLTWIGWMKETLPAGAGWLAAGDPAWQRLRGEPWTKETIGFRTRHLLLFTRDLDPAAIGLCLRNGEGAIRALAGLLGGGDDAAVPDDSRRLEVRIFKDRAEFLREGAASGLRESVAGYYSPGENVTRFYVPRGEQAGAGLVRETHRVLAHELTHHFVEAVFMKGVFEAEERGPGFWVVEGIARFIEDQAVEMGRRASGSTTRRSSRWKPAPFSRGTAGSSTCAGSSTSARSGSTASASRGCITSRPGTRWGPTSSVLSMSSTNRPAASCSS